MYYVPGIYVPGTYCNHLGQSMHRTGKVAILSRGQLNKENQYFPVLSLFAPDNLVSRGGFKCPVPRQSPHLHTQAESGLTHGTPSDFRGGVHLFIIPPFAIWKTRVYQFAQVRTDGVHCRESTGTRPVVLKVVPVAMGAVFSYGRAKCNRQSVVCLRPSLPSFLKVRLLLLYY